MLAGNIKRILKEETTASEVLSEVVEGVPKCKLDFRDGRAFVVCETKEDQKLAYEAVVEGITIEVKPEKVLKIVE